MAAIAISGLGGPSDKPEGGHAKCELTKYHGNKEVPQNAVDKTSKKHHLRGWGEAHNLRGWGEAQKAGPGKSACAPHGQIQL
eukprot:5629753-Amphidinium_carterae.1